MRTRRLGNFTVSAIGGGDVCLATSAARGVYHRDVEQALHEAIAFGINLFDVAADRDSEQFAGDAVRAQKGRDRVVIATRVPALAELPGAPKRDRLSERMPAAYVQASVEATLRASRLEVLPLVQLALRPGWLASTAWPELVGTCARLVREGKVLAWGAWLAAPGPPAARPEPSNPGKPGEPAAADAEPDVDLAASDLADDAALALIAEPWLAAVSVAYQLCDRRAERLFAAATQRELAILARAPLAGGALAGRLGPGVSLTPRDDRQSIEPAMLERIAIGCAKLAPLVKQPPAAVRASEAARAIAETGQRPDHVECTDIAELALRFAIDRAGIALPRLHRREHLLAGIAAAAAPPLSASLIARIVGNPGDS